MQDNTNKDKNDRKEKRSKTHRTLRKSKSDTEKNYNTSSHTAQRMDRERQKLRKEKQAARKAELRKKGMIVGAAVLVVLLVIFLAACPGKKQKKEKESAAHTTVNQENKEAVAETSASDAEADEATGHVSASEVRHFSFGMLLADEMAGDNSALTVNQFRQILQQLYDADYILVDFYSIADVEQNEDGSKAYTPATLNIPEGKIPFVLSQRDVSYSFDRIGKGYASRMIIDGDQLTNEYQRSDGAQMRDSYDVVPVLEEFIAEHPDFSYENARGVIGLTGYNGVLGYRTSEILGKTTEEGNPYAIYGTYDVNAEIEACKPVIEALKNKGWHFACYGDSYCSYGAEYAMMTTDLENWKHNVEKLIGGTDLLMFPCETDIGPWSEYKVDNRKYQYLKKQGFDYFCIEEKNNPSWLQIRPDYVRQGMKEIDNIDDFTQLVGE